MGTRDEVIEGTVRDVMRRLADLPADEAVRAVIGQSDPDVTGEIAAIAAAVAESDADPRTIPHDDVRAWLLRLANGEFDAAPPQPS